MISTQNVHSIKSHGWYDKNKIKIYASGMEHTVPSPELRKLLLDVAAKYAKQLNDEEDYEKEK